MKSWIGIGCLAAACLVAGCGDGGKSGGSGGGGAAPAPPQDAGKQDAGKAPEVAGPPGSIKGKTVFKGEPPKPGPIDMSKDAKCAAKHASPVMEEFFLAGDGNTLGNVVVEIGKGPKAWKAKAAAEPVPTTPFVLDQAGCMYVPHVFALRAGTPFQAKNSDETDHNVHFYGESNKSGKDNVAHAKGAPNVSFDLKNAEENPVTFKCDVHPWMMAYSRIVDHNAFSVTKKDGAFEFKDLPPGEYTVQGFHERFDGAKKKKVTVPPGGSVEVEIVFGFE